MIYCVYFIFFLLAVTLSVIAEETTSCLAQFFPHPEDCGKFYRCNHGRPVLFDCPGGLHWNDNVVTCDWPTNANCKLGSTTKNPWEKQAVQRISEELEEIPEPAEVPKKPKAQKVRRGRKPKTDKSTASSTTSLKADKITSKSTKKKQKSKLTTPVPISTSSCTEGDGDEFKVVCYFTNWAWYRSDDGKYFPEDIDEKLCTHVIYGFVALDGSNQTIQMHNSLADIDNKFYERVTAYKQMGLKVLLAIGGWNDSFGDKYSKLVATKVSRQTFIQNAVSFIKENNFDGLDLNWQYPACWQSECYRSNPEDKGNFAEFVKELSKALKSNGLLLTAAVSPIKQVIDGGYDIPKLSKYLDWFNVMTYDYHGSNERKTGHMAPLYYTEGYRADYFADFTINYLIQSGAPSKKIVMGIPTYGHTFTLSNAGNNGLNAPSSGAGEAGKYTRNAGTLSFFEICDRVENEGWTVERDPETENGPYAHKGNQWVSYDDVDSVRAKANFIRDMKLGGGMIWSLDLDDFKGNCGFGKYPLLTALNQGLCKVGGSVQSSINIINNYLLK